uniref:Uncharacterized protein n=1 Tax=Globisporangium ultimum (strain ATCC 200006 / CBS 805.95 / DAOM BR144) TaxID=431595 RepID=K3W968_GLOUD
MACMGFGAVMFLTFTVRQVTVNPDVKWSPSARRSQEAVTVEQTASWMAHRKKLRNMSDNPMNAVHPENQQRDA